MNIKFPLKTVCILGIIHLLFSCSDLKFGDELLNQQPEGTGATLDSMFCSKVNADKVLTKAYTELPYGLPVGGRDRLGPSILEAITDFAQDNLEWTGNGARELYYTGALSANSINGSAAYYFTGENDWTAIRYGWLFIENVEKVPDMSESEKAQRIAEAKMIIAISYAGMFRNIGGVPWLDHAVQPNEDMNYPRLTFAETVDRIIGLIDEAIPNLKWTQTEADDGRMTKAGAMALKLRVLTFAASPAFNSNTPYHPNANEYACYGNEDRNRWKRAMEAGEELMKAIQNNGYYGLVQPKGDSHIDRRLAFREAYYDRGTTESLISTRVSSSNVNSEFHWNSSAGCPTLNYVNIFPWADGEKFPEDFDWKNPTKAPFYEEYSEKDGEGLSPTRDPRLYETVAVPGSHYWDGNIVASYTNSPNYNKKLSGFYLMKWDLPSGADREGHLSHWPYLRFAESLLSYAEAINEYKNGPDATAYDCVNDVRRRVGLSDLKENMNQTEFREALLQERACELGFEEVRWYDLVRWKMEKDFRKPLYGLRTKGLGSDVYHPTGYTYEPFLLETRNWNTKWDTKWYLAPIPQKEVNKNYGMTQNPGW